jgi:hypothetical protein
MRKTHKTYKIKYDEKENIVYFKNSKSEWRIDTQAWECIKNREDFESYIQDKYDWYGLKYSKNVYKILIPIS